MRNHVIQVPKLRPASPHSSSEWMPASGLRQRAAQNPATVTSRKKKQKMMRAVLCIKGAWFARHLSRAREAELFEAGPGFGPLVDHDAEVAERFHRRLHGAAD